MIDEQHRFGVEQRIALTDKGPRRRYAGHDGDADPAHLELTVYGDLDVSRLDEKPPGRKPVDTRPCRSAAGRGDRGGRGARSASGAKVYWICPLVEESEDSDLAAAEDRYRRAAKRCSARGSAWCTAA